MDPMFKDSWHDLREHEKGDDFEELSIRQEERTNLAYEQIKGLENHSKMSGILVRDLQEAVVHYIKAIDKLSVAKIKDEDKGEKENADLARRLAHNALIDNLNMLSRYCVKHGLDTSWRKMVGSDRNQVRDWALSVASTVINERI